MPRRALELARASELSSPERNHLLFLLRHVTCGFLWVSFSQNQMWPPVTQRTWSALSTRTERTTSSTARSGGAAVSPSLSMALKKKKEKKESLFFTLELIRFYEIQGSVNKQLHCCQDQLALNYYWKSLQKKNPTGNIKTT